MRSNIRKIIRPFVCLSLFAAASACLWLSLAPQARADAADDEEAKLKAAVAEYKATGAAAQAELNQCYQECEDQFSESTRRCFGGMTHDTSHVPSQECLDNAKAEYRKCKPPCKRVYSAKIKEAERKVQAAARERRIRSLVPGK